MTPVINLAYAWAGVEWPTLPEVFRKSLSSIAQTCNGEEVYPSTSSLVIFTVAQPSPSRPAASRSLAHGNSTGVVIDVRVFNRHGIDKDERSITIERAEIESVQEDKKVEEEILERNIKQRFLEIAGKEKLSKGYKKNKPGDTLDIEELSNIKVNECLKEIELIIK